MLEHSEQSPSSRAAAPDARSSKAPALWDVIVIGGSYAGLSSATMLARGRRNVLVLDAGQRRNRFAAHSHGVLAQDRRPGAEIVEVAAAQLARHSSVQQVAAHVASVAGADGAFRVRTEDGRDFRARKLLLATGVTDGLPDLPGLPERWGRSVFHCPYCHGYEIGGGPIGVLATGEASVAQAVTLADWGEISYFTQAIDLAEEQLQMLRRRGVTVETRPVAALDGPVGGPIDLRLADGGRARVKALFLASRQTVSPLAQAIGCAIDRTPHGEMISTGPDKQTSVPGLYAAGDTARLPTNVTMASADGVLAGAAIHQALSADHPEQTLIHRLPVERLLDVG